MVFAPGTKGGSGHDPGERMGHPYCIPEVFVIPVVYPLLFGLP